jgi:hypothetical protein
VPHIIDTGGRVRGTVEGPSASGTNSTLRVDDDEVLAVDGETVVRQVRDRLLVAGIGAATVKGDDERVSLCVVECVRLAMHQCPAVVRQSQVVVSSTIENPGIADGTCLD